MTTPISTASEIPVSDRPRRHPLRYVLAGLVLLCLLVWAGNYLLVGLPVSNELGSDPRNGGYHLSARYRLYVDPSTLVLNLRSVDQAAPLDLFRGLFQAAKAMHEHDRSFSKVVLERAGKSIFMIEGSAFAELGAEYAAGQNPIYLIRTLPEKVYHLDGNPAYGTWTGGWLGVMGRQMDDVNQFAQEWVKGG